MCGSARALLFFILQDAVLSMLHVGLVQVRVDIVLVAQLVVVLVHVHVVASPHVTQVSSTSAIQHQTTHTLRARVPNVPHPTRHHCLQRTVYNVYINTFSFAFHPSFRHPLSPADLPVRVLHLEYYT